MLIGSDVKLNSPSSLIGQALAEILQYPDKARDALRVLLHLVSVTQSIQFFSHTENQNPNTVTGLVKIKALLLSVNMFILDMGVRVLS